MRCSECRKFVSYEGEEEPEIEDSRITREGELEIEIRIVKRCGECATELKEAQFTLVEDLAAALESEGIAADDWADLHIEAEATPSEQVRHGITFYGVDLAWTIRNRPYGRFVAGPGDLHEDIAASAMDELD